MESQAGPLSRNDDLHIHHMTSVAGFVFQLGTAFFTRVSFDIRMGEDVVGNLFLGLESFST